MILITDILSRVVAGTVNREGRPGSWRCCPYRCQEYSGVLVGCGTDTNPEPLTVRLGLQGLYRIRLGIFRMYEGSRFPTTIRVRLTGDTCCRRLTVPVSGWGSDVYLYEMLWREADLTGRDLILEGEFGRLGSLASIRLEPIDALSESAKPDTSFPLAVTEDGYGAFSARPHRRPEDLLEDLDQIPADSCMKILLWCISGADVCNFPTKIGTYNSGRGGDSLAPVYRMHRENARLWRAKGWDSMQVMKDYARKRGWEFHVSMRAEAFSAHYPFDEDLFSRFFDDHPEWRCIDEKGEPIGRMSYAYLEVQDHLLSVIEEILAYRPDGINIIFIRGMPLVLYEPAAIESFRGKYGLDPLALEETDERWLNHKAGIVTSYLRKIKTRLKKDQRLSVMVPPDERRCLWGGLDIAAWIRERIVDDVYPTGLEYDEHDVHRDGAHRLDIDYFLNLPGREHVRIIPVLSEEVRPAWCRLLRSHLNKGSDGYCLWDGARGSPRYAYYLGGRRLPSYREKKPEYRAIPLERLGDFRIDRYHPWEVF